MPYYLKEVKGYRKSLRNNQLNTDKIINVDIQWNIILKSF